MVRLGFVSTSGALPQGFWNLIFRPGKDSPDIQVTTNVRPGTKGDLEYELFLDIPPDKTLVDQWVQPMAERLKDMGLTRFSFDPRTLAQALGLDVSDALGAWGFPFFQHYAIESQVLLQTGDNRQAIYPRIREWHERLPHVHFDPELDYETQAQTDEQHNSAREGRPRFWRTLLNRTSKR